MIKKDNKKIICKYIIYIFLGLIVILFSVYLINLLIRTKSIFEVAQNNDWIGFWGSVLGSAIGGIITFIVLKITIDNETKKREEDIRMNIYPFLDYNIVCNEYIESNFKTKESRYGIYKQHKLCSAEIPFEYKCNVEFKLAIENIGINKAIKPKVIDKYEKKDTYLGNKYIDVGDNILIDISMSLDKRIIQTHTLELSILYYNLRMNLYRQDIKIEYKPMSIRADDNITIALGFHPSIVEISTPVVIDTKNK